MNGTFQKAPRFAGSARPAPLPARTVSVVVAGRTVWEGAPTIANRARWGQHGNCYRRYDLVNRMYADSLDVALEAAGEACPGCPVAEACLELGITEREKWGVWGGIPAKANEFRALIELRSGRTPGLNIPAALFGQAS